MTVTVLTEAELRECVGLDRSALDAVRDAFTWVSAGRVNQPPIMHIEIPSGPGDVDIKSAYVQGFDSLAVKVASGFFGNTRQGLPSSSAMVVVLSARTGFCEAVLLDNGYLTDLRTGLAGAVAAEQLAPEEVSTVGVVGAGAQARYQLQSLALVRNFGRVLLKGRSAEREQACVAELREMLGVEVQVAPDLQTLVRESEVVITTTPSREPLIRAEWLHPGLHITAMGSDLAGKQELEAGCLSRADLFVCDRRSQCVAMGELQHPVTDGLVDADASGIPELGELTGGSRTGRTSAQQITVCDLTGMGAQDTAIANVALARANAAGMGLRIPASA